MRAIYDPKTVIKPEWKWFQSFLKHVHDNDAYDSDQGTIFLDSDDVEKNNYKSEEGEIEKTRL